MKKLLIGLIFLMAFLILPSKIIAGVHDEVFVTSLERISNGDVLYFPATTADNNYLVINIHDTYYVWTSTPLTTEQKGQFISSFLAAASLSGDYSYFDSFSIGNTVAWLSETGVYDGWLNIETSCPEPGVPGGCLIVIFYDELDGEVRAIGEFDFIGDTVTISVRKEWELPEGITSPNSAIVKIMVGTTEVAQTTLNDDNDWFYVFTLPKYDSNDDEIQYMIIEENVPSGYSVQLIEDTELDNDLDYNYILINKYGIEEETTEVDDVVEETPETGASLSFVLLGIGIISNSLIYALITKKKRFYQI